MHDKTITMAFTVILAIGSLIIMGITMSLLFSGDPLEFAAGFLASITSVYAVFDVSKNL